MSIIHISEAEAAHDFSAVLAQLRSSECVVVACSDGTEATIRLRRTADGPEGRTIAEAREILRRRRETRALAMVDDAFAADMEVVHALYNEPMPSPQWD